MKRTIHSTFRVPLKKAGSTGASTSPERPLSSMPAAAAAPPPPPLPPLPHGLSNPRHSAGQNEDGQHILLHCDESMPPAPSFVGCSTVSQDKENGLAFTGHPSTLFSSTSTSYNTIKSSTEDFPHATGRSIFRKVLKSAFKPPSKKVRQPTTMFTASSSPSTSSAILNSSTLSSSFVTSGPAPTNPLAASTTVKDCEEGETKRFIAMYTKNTQKKKKTWLEGVLLVEPMPGGNSKLSLQSESGKVEARKTLYARLDAVKEGDHLTMMHFQVEVGEPRAAVVPGLLAGMLDDHEENNENEWRHGARKLTFGSKFVVKAPAKAMPGGSASARGHSSAPARPLEPRVVKEDELLLYDPAWGTKKQSRPAGRHLKGEVPTKPVVLEAFLGRILRPHQREGVAFLWRCLTGRGQPSRMGRGAILADDMGLGKTLQTIALLWALTRQSPFQHRYADVEKAVVVCPSSLLNQWAAELKKWLQVRLSFMVVDSAMGKALGKGDAKEQVNTFCTSSGQHSTVLFISYEGYRIHAAALNACQQIGLLICDEAHRLKEGGSKTLVALAASPAQARLALTGTPVQNDLEEFYSLVDFVNPGVLGPLSSFRSNYISPILRARDPKASSVTKQCGEKRTREVMALVSRFFLRRTAAAVLKTLIPPRTSLVVFCRLAPVQRKLYQEVVRIGLMPGVMGHDPAVASALGLKMIDALRKICNHPCFFSTEVSPERSENIGREGEGRGGLSESAIIKILRTTRSNSAADLDEDKKGGSKSGKMGGGKKSAGGQTRTSLRCPIGMSGKLAVTEELLEAIYAQTADRVVVCSSYTLSLDMLQDLCQARGWHVLRLDGSVSISQRHGLVEAFNRGAGCLAREKEDPFVFLLSTRAGGQGLNLVGGNRLILFDSCFNPSADLQAQARVWRDGQRKPCVLYRLLSAGTMEEKVFQRQISKRELHSTLVENTAHETRNFSPDELRKLFVLAGPHVRCETYDLLRSGGGRAEGKREWKDYTGPKDIPDACLRSVVEAQGTGGSLVNFVHEEEDGRGEEEDKEKKRGDDEGDGDMGLDSRLVHEEDSVEDEEVSGFGGSVAVAGSDEAAIRKRKKIVVSCETESDDEFESIEGRSGEKDSGRGAAMGPTSEGGSRDAEEGYDMEEEEEWETLMNS